MPKLDGPLSKIFARARGTRRHGYLRSPLDTRDHSAEVKYGLDQGVLPTSFTLRGSITSPALPFDQLSTGSCVGQGEMGQVVVAELVRGVATLVPSRLDAYYNARKNAPDRPKKVTDDGCDPRVMAQIVQKMGVCPETTWPFIESRVNKPPSWEARREAYARSGAHYSFILSERDARVRAIQSVLVSQKLPVGVGTLVGYSYEDPNGPDIADVPLNEPIAGGHYEVIVGYETTQSDVLFEVLNSWGSSWRDGGYVRWTSNYIKWVNTGDLLVLDGWRALR